MYFYSPGFEVAYVKWSDGYAIGPSNRAPLKEGTYPDGDYTSENYMEITYCCRRDGFIANGINLPIGKIKNCDMRKQQEQQKVS